MKFLIIEDDYNKLNSIIKCIREMDKGTIDSASSFHSGLKKLSSSKYDLVLLDMSMPLYDISGHDDGGRPLPLAGRDLLSKIHLRKISCKAIVITQYEDFGGHSIKDLNNDLRRSFPEIYMGLIYYNTMQDTWKIELKEFITKFSGDNYEDINS